MKENIERESEAKKFIKTMLGDANMEIELQDSDYEIIEEQTMDVIAPYYEGIKYIYSPTSDTINLSNYPEVVSVHQILKSNSDNSDFLQALYFGAPGVYIWDSRTMDTYLSYVAIQQLYTNFLPMKAESWKFIKPNVFIHGYSGPIILECFVRPTKFSDIDRSSDKYPLAKQYALALAKEIVGRTRSRFTVAGSPYQLDGQALIAEAQTEKADVISRIIPPIRVY